MFSAAVPNAVADVAAALAAMQRSGAFTAGALCRPLSGSPAAAAATKPAPRSAAADVTADQALTREAKFFLNSTLEVTLLQHFAVPLTWIKHRRWSCKANSKCSLGFLDSRLVCCFTRVHGAHTPLGDGRRRTRQGHCFAWYMY